MEIQAIQAAQLQLEGLRIQSLQLQQMQQQQFNLHPHQRLLLAQAQAETEQRAAILAQALQNVQLSLLHSNIVASDPPRTATVGSMHTAQASSAAELRLQAQGRVHEALRARQRLQQAQNAHLSQHGHVSTFDEPQDVDVYPDMDHFAPRTAPLPGHRSMSSSWRKPSSGAGMAAPIPRSPTIVLSRPDELFPDTSSAGDSDTSSLGSEGRGSEHSQTPTTSEGSEEETRFDKAGKENTAPAVTSAPRSLGMGAAPLNPLRRPLGTRIRSEVGPDRSSGAGSPPSQLTLQPTRQPRGPPAAVVSELGSKNFASRIRRRAIKGILGARVGGSGLDGVCNGGRSVSMPVGA